MLGGFLKIVLEIAKEVGRPSWLALQCACAMVAHVDQSSVVMLDSVGGKGAA